MELLLIRHAEPERVFGVEGGAPADPGLTPLGQRQAKALAAWLESEPIDAIWASPLRRALDTARPLADALGLAVQTEDALAEYDRDHHTYLPVEERELLPDDPWLRLLAAPIAEVTDEQALAFLERVRAGVERVIAAGGQRVVAVCHGGVVNAYLATVLETPRALFFFPEYTSVSRVRASRSRPLRSMASINETAHLRGL
jgi:2,3-bisphosphoglycerate-dependent phosphoglycerate mutase